MCQRTYIIFNLSSFGGGNSDASGGCGPLDPLSVQLKFNCSGFGFFSISQQFHGSYLDHKKDVKIISVNNVTLYNVLYIYYKPRKMNNYLQN